MRLRQWMLMIGGLAALLVTGVLAYLFLTPVHPISEQTFQHIQPGMTQETVEQLLGEPGDYRTEVLGFDHIEFVNRDGEERVWKSDHGYIYVWFDERGIVLSAEFVPPVFPRNTIFEKLRRVFAKSKTMA